MVESVTLLVLVCFRIVIKLTEHAIDYRTRRALVCERRLLLEKAAGLPVDIVMWERTRASSWVMAVTDSGRTQTTGKA